MPKLVKRVAKNFTVINNAIFQNKKLKAFDRGILCTMLSLPEFQENGEPWNFSIKGLAKILPDGETAIRHSLQRLEAAHYLIRRRVYENGRVVDWEYIFSDEPMSVDDDSEKEEKETQTATLADSNLDVVNLDVENQQLENLTLEKPHDNKENKYKEQKEKLLIEKESINQSAPKPKKSKSETNDGLMDGFLQKQKRYLEVVKDNIGYDDYVLYGSGYIETEELDEIVGIIVRAICSEKPTENICGQEFPREVVRSTMLKVDMTCIENALENMKQTENIRNHEKYLLSTLFNEANGRHFKENSEERWAEYAVKQDFGY